MVSSSSCGFLQSLLCVLMFSTTLGQITTLEAKYQKNSDINFNVTDSHDISKTSVFISNNQGPHFFNVLVRKVDSKLDQISVTLPSTFASGKGFFFEVVYEGKEHYSYKSSEFEITGSGFEISDSSLSFSFPSRDIVVDIDTVYDVQFNQHYLFKPVKLSSYLVRADSINLGIFPLNDNLSPGHFSFEWNVSSDISTSKFYYIYVEAEFENTKSGSFSPQFSINNPNDVGIADGINVKFNFPKSSNVLLINEQYTISWDYLVEPTSTVVVQLLKTNNNEIKIASNLGVIDNSQSAVVDGAFNVTVPNVSPGNFYQILLTGKMNNDFVFSELSQVFSIDITNDNGLLFTLPQVDDLYFVNQEYDVNFNFTGSKVPKSVEFELCKGAFDTFPIDQTIAEDASKLTDFVDGKISELSFRIPVFTVSSIITLNYDNYQSTDGFTFQIPFFVTSGKDYFIRAQIKYQDDLVKQFSSPSFAVQGGSDSSVVQVSLPIPGQVLKIGDVYNIGWTLHAIGSVNSLTIELFRATDVVVDRQIKTQVTKVKSIAENLQPRKITFMWTVDSDLDPEGSYYIRVVGHTDTEDIVGVGGEFYISTAAIPLRFRVLKRDYSSVQKMVSAY